MNLSVKTSNFGTLVGCMSDYGLVDTGGGQIKVTDLGETLVYAEGDEKRRAQDTAVRKILLFVDIFDQFGAQPTEEQLKLFLREKAKVELSKASGLASVVGKLLNKVLPYLTASTKSQAGEKPKMSRGTTTMSDNPEWELSTDSYGELRIVDDLSADYAINLLKKFKERVTPKEVRLATPEDLGFSTEKEKPKK
ncbi:MAG TPA: hypothetical protein VJN71_11265 [Nitrososphaerales archaeon]|nr:hypothetical protein [Nitrososphaerales archaeon]